MLNYRGVILEILSISKELVYFFALPKQAIISRRHDDDAQIIRDHSEWGPTQLQFAAV